MNVTIVDVLAMLIKFRIIHYLMRKTKISFNFLCLCTVVDYRRRLTLLFFPGSGVSSSLIGGGGAIFIYSYSALLIYFQTILFMVCEHEIMKIAPPPPQINALATPLVLRIHIVMRYITVQKHAKWKCIFKIIFEGFKSRISVLKFKDIIYAGSL